MSAIGYVSTTGDTRKVSKAGDTMTGELTLPDSSPDAALRAASKGYVDAGVAADAAPWVPADHGYLGWTYDPSMTATGTILGTAGLLYVAKVKLASAGLTVTSCVIFLTAAGVTLTAGRNFAALFTAAGGILAQSVDQSTAWQTAGEKICTLSAPQVVPTRYCYVGVWANGSTLPTLARGSSSGSTLLNGSLSAPNFRFATCDTGLTTAAPATLGTQTAFNAAWWMAIK